MKKIIILQILLLISVGIFAQTATAPITGDGTSTNPYRIISLDNLYWIAASDAVVPSPTYAQRMSSYYMQMNNIDASSTSSWFSGAGWIPIGTSTYPFIGNYEGMFCSIINLSINRPTTNFMAFIGELGTFDHGNGIRTVKNLTLENVDIIGRGYVAGLIGFASYKSIIKNCHVSGEINGALTGDPYQMGFVGGLIGSSYEVRIEYCSASCDVEGRAYVGGLVGYIDGISNVMGGYWAITNSFSTGSVTGAEMWVGGLVGSSGYIVRKSYSRSSVVGGGNCVGGLMGQTDAGGIWRCYSTGSVSGCPDPDFMGGLVGFSHNGTDDVSNYWDTQTSGQTSSAAGTGKSTSQMKTQSTYVNWDFTNTWKVMASSINNGYPALYEVEVEVPSMLTTDPTDIRPSKAMLNGSVQGTGIPDFIYQYGFCWSTTSNPTIADSHIDMGIRTTTGSISYELDGLEGNTTYYVRSFAENGVGMSYGNEVSFTTLDGLLPIGLGTTDNPYVITNLDNLIWMYNAKEWDKNYIQGNDIDASETSSWNGGEGFIPVGNSTIAFTGSYDGNGKSITSLYINRPTESNVGMFGVANNGASFAYVNLTNANIIGGTTSVGILVGSLTNGSINNCTSGGNVRGSTKVGGLVGYNTNSNIKNSNNIAQVRMSANTAGGIAGYSNGSSIIEDCKNTGKVYTLGAWALNLGGIVGANLSTIQNCENTGNVEGARRIGGIVGNNFGLIDKCKNSGNVISGTSNYAVGGIAGYHSGGGATISRTYNTGSISAGSGTYNVGGIVGEQVGGSFIDNSYNLGDVSTSGYRVGGAVGIINESTIINCYSIGLVSGSYYLGGLIGYNYNSSTITGCFWNTETSQQASSQGGTGLTTEDMQDLSVYTDAGWTFVGDGNRSAGCTEDCWDIDLSSTMQEGYPFLGIQEAPLTWNGSESNDWNTVGNWTGSLGGPSEYKEIIIPLTSNHPIINYAPDNPAKCASLRLEEGATLTLSPNCVLTVEDNDQ